MQNQTGKTPGARDWVQGCSGVVFPKEEEDRLLTQVFAASENELQELEQLARAQQCPILLRQAALDRYAHLKGSHAIELLLEIADFTKEGSEDMRAVACQWLASQEPAPKGRVQVRGATRIGKYPGANISNWRQQAASDPSPRVRCLASLGT